MGDHRLGRYAAFDQPRRRRYLRHRAGAGPADQFGPPCDDHTEVRRNDIEALGGVLADDRHCNFAAGTIGILGRQRHVDTRQMRRQGTAAGPALGRCVLALLRIALLNLGLAASDGLLQRFKAELQLLLRQTLGFGTELHALKFEQEMTNAVVLLGKGITFAGRGITFRHQHHYQSAQALDVVRQARQSLVRGVHGTRILRRHNRFVNRFYCLHPRPIEPVEQSCEFYRRKLHNAVYDRRPAKRTFV
jgi:hypothetical protein